jgi:phosphoserine phosphatase
MTSRLLCAFVLILNGVVSAIAQAPDPLPSWNDNASKKAIIAFVDAVTRPGSPDFVAIEERIATFDNDGTLWVEQPAYTQAFFIVDRLKALAPLHPEWVNQEPMAAVLKSGVAALGTASEADLVKLVAVTHAGMTPAAFREIVARWLNEVRHPRFQKPFTELTYQPMQEVLSYFRQNGFKTYIVSGGGVEFMRAFAERTYGVPPEQVIGSRAKTIFEMRDGRAQLFRDGAIDFIDDKKGKPIAIEQIIGRRPIAAFGNSDGDLEMLQWTTQSGGRRLGVIVHHTDADREYAYDRQSSVGRLDAGLVAAQMDGWTVVDMKQDWKVIFPFEKR